MPSWNNSKEYISQVTWILITKKTQKNMAAFYPRPSRNNFNPGSSNPDKRLQSVVMLRYPGMNINAPRLPGGVQVVIKMDADDATSAGTPRKPNTEFRLGVVGIVFLVAGALVCVVPGVLTRRHSQQGPDGQNKDPRASFSGDYMATGGALFALGGLMILANIVWCVNEQRLLKEEHQSSECQEGIR